jgi:diaminopimelate epimerase
MHSNGNDFVIIDARKKTIKLKKGNIIDLCNRNFGIGCDQLIIMQDTKDADIEMLIYNADGSKSGACGNAAKCVASLLQKENGIIKVQKRMLDFRVKKDLVSINMGQVTANAIRIPNPYPGFENGYYAELGNPHLIFFVEKDALENIDLDDLGACYNTHTAFPDGVNVSCVTVHEEDSEMIASAFTFERGAGVTLSCGSAAAAIGYVFAKFIAKQKQCLLSVDQIGGTNFVNVDGDDTHIVSKVTNVFDGKITL